MGNVKWDKDLSTEKALENKYTIILNKSRKVRRLPFTNYGRQLNQIVISEISTAIASLQAVDVSCILSQASW